MTKMLMGSDLAKGLYPPNEPDLYEIVCIESPLSCRLGRPQRMVVGEAVSRIACEQTDWEIVRVVIEMMTNRMRKCGATLGEWYVFGVWDHIYYQ